MTAISISFSVAISCRYHRVLFRKLKELASTNASSCPYHKNEQQSIAKEEKKFSSLLDRVINNNKLSRDEAITVCVELLAGGIDTTATAAIFTMYHLSRNPDHQQQLRALLERENKGKKIPNREKSVFSKYLKACIWESMRLNPLTFANVRTTEKDLVLSGYHVPAGTTVRYTSHLMNLQSEDFYKDPETFRPERWSERNSPYR